MHVLDRLDEIMGAAAGAAVGNKVGKTAGAFLKTGKQNTQEFKAKMKANMEDVGVLDRADVFLAEMEELDEGLIGTGLKAAATGAALYGGYRLAKKVFGPKKPKKPGAMEDIDDVLDYAHAVMGEGIIQPKDKAQMMKLKKRSNIGHLAHGAMRFAAGGPTPLAPANAIRYGLKVDRAKRGLYGKKK